MRVREVDSRAGEWDEFVRASAHGSPFHLTAWRRVVERSFGFRAYYLVADDGGEIRGVLPLFMVRTLGGERALVSVPYGVYGGVCSESPQASRALVEAATELGRRHGAAYVELRHRYDEGLPLPTKSLYVTFARPIAPSDEENARAIPGKQRRMTRQGARYGLRAVVGQEHLDDVYAVYAESMRNLGSPVFPRHLFRAIAELFDKECLVLSVWQGNRVVAGVLTLLYQDQVLPYYGGALPRALRYAPSDFMYWELMRYGARAGYGVFDFGRSRIGTGAYDFKRHWGFSPVPLPYQYVLLKRRSLPDLSPSNRRLSVATRVWRRLPVAITNRLGPVVTRYLP